MFDTAEINELTQAELTGEWVESDRQVLPDDLEMIPPGLILATVLGSVDASRLNGHHLVRVMKAHARLEAHFAAEKMSVMAELAYCPRGGPQAEVVRDPVEVEFASTEIGTALHLTRQAADSQLGFALQLRERLPRVWELLASGLIDVARARTIVDGTDHLSEGTARQVVERIIEAAPKLTTGQLWARIRRLSVETDPEEAKTRYQEALSERRVVSQASPDGTADLYGMGLPPERVVAITRFLNKTARSFKANGDPRTMDQLRADIYLDLLQGNHVSGGPNRAIVDITVDLITLTGLSETPGELAGVGPVIADIARQVTAEQDNAEWRYTVTDNRGVHTGITTRRPTTALKRLVQAQHRTCIFPGCRMPSGDCDLDHTIAVIDGGPTTENNLAPLCRHHHRAKHQAPWKPRRLPNGDHQFTSPLGHAYTTSGIPPP